MENLTQRSVVLFISPDLYLTTLTVPKDAFWAAWLLEHGEMRSDGLITALAVNARALQAPREVSLVIDPFDAVTLSFEYRNAMGKLHRFEFDGFDYVEQPFPEVALTLAPGRCGIVLFQ